MPDAGERPERPRKLVKTCLDKPLKTLPIDANGYAFIPTPDEVCHIRQMTELSNETEALLKEWRARFHQMGPWPAEQQPTQQPTPHGEENDPPTPPRTGATDPPAGMPGTQPLAQAVTKASKEEL